MQIGPSSSAMGYHDIDISLFSCFFFGLNDCQTTIFSSMDFLSRASQLLAVDLLVYRWFGLFLICIAYMSQYNSG